MKKIFPHVFVLFAFLTLIYLGTWQVQRREEKQTMLAKIDSNTHAAPILLSDFKNIDGDEFKKMTITGNYLYNKEFFLLNKTYGNKAGQHVMTPIKTETGEVILVNRGWIPTDKEYEKPQGKVIITGLIRASQKLTGIGKLVIMDNNPQKQVWFWLDLPAIYQNLQVPEKTYYLILINENKSTSYPITLAEKIEVYNEHLIYIIIWYSLSIALLVVYYFRFWKK